MDTELPAQGQKPASHAPSLWRMVFDTTDDAIVLADPHTLQIRDANPAACRLFGYSRAALTGIRAADLVHPDSLEQYAAHGGRAIDRLAGVGRRADGSAIDVEVSARDVEYDGATIRCIVMRPITDSSRTFELLEGRVEQRTRELMGLLQVSQMLSGTLQLEPLLGVVLDQLASVVEYTEAWIMCVEGDELSVLEYRGPHLRETAVGRRQPVEAAPIFQAVLAQNGPVIVDDASHSVLGVPLRVNDRIIGQIRLEHRAPRFYSSAHADLALAIANQAAIALDNAHLYQEAERRRRELEALYNAEEALYRTLEPDEVLEALIGAATDLLGADKTTVLLWDTAHQRLNVHASRGLQPETLAPTSYEVPIKVGADVFGVFNLQYASRHAFTPHELRLIQSLAQRAAIALDNARTFAAERATRERLDVALAAGRMGTWEWDVDANTLAWSPRLEIIHGLQPGSFPGTIAAYLDGIHPDDRERVRQTIADSLADGEIQLEYRVPQLDGSVRWFEATGRAIRDARGGIVGMHGVCQDVSSRKLEEEERAQLQARERAASEARAALEERQRLARELHDSVSQALYGIALGSQTTLAALAERRDVAAAEDAARYVHKLAEAALAEMRALILELRPEAVEHEGLVAALERQVDSVRARHGMHVQARLGREPDLPPETKQALYRIAQEGVHNALKHARASSLRLNLRHTDHTVTLEIADDGVGFDPNGTYAGHLGLTSMRERAADAHGTLQIESTSGRGTRVIVTVPAAANRAA